MGVPGRLFCRHRRDARGRRPWPPTPLGPLLAFGAGALISASASSCWRRAPSAGGPAASCPGLAPGARTYFVLNRGLEARRSPREAHPALTRGRRPALALGAFLDGIPEQLALGIAIAAGDGVSIGLLVAIFVSNLPESIGSASEMRAAGTARRNHAALDRVAVIWTLATVVGYVSSTTSRVTQRRTGSPPERCS